MKPVFYSISNSEIRIGLKLFSISLLLVMVITACGVSTTNPGITINQDDTPVSSSPTEVVTDHIVDTGMNRENNLLQSVIMRDTSPQVPAEDLNLLVYGNCSFAFDFYHAVHDYEGNLIFSPYSLSTALAMTFAGARQDTEAQMASTMHYQLPQDRLHPAFNSLDLLLNNHSEESGVGQNAPQFQLKVANSLWGQQDYHFLPSYIDVLGINYGAGLRMVDFENQPEEVRQQINRWVENETEEKIKDLIPPGAINPATALVLANAIYFNADWLYTFSPDRTQPGPFYPIDSASLETDLMSYSEAVLLPYYQGEGYQALDLPYREDRVSMLLVVPDQGKFIEFEDRLDQPMLDSIINRLTPIRMQLYLPKFRFSSNFELAQTLADMGMSDAFDGGKADFSGMDGTRNLAISEIFHKAFVAVDERGTEAAAATAVVMKRSIALEPEFEMMVDRPFIFLIRDRMSGSILFMGRVVSP